MDVKKMMMAGFCMLALTLTAGCADRQSNNIADLPEPAQQFLKQYFPDQSLVVIIIDREVMQPTEYTAKLSDGAKLEFDNKGNWREVEYKRGGVPKTLIPEAIRSNAAAVAPNEYITKIEKTRRGYEIELSNGIDIAYDKNGNLLKFDD